MPKDLQLLIKPVSADCNQSCEYCFYRRAGALYPGSGAHRMSADVLECVVRRYLRLRQPQSVFCWQGGEPTLAGLDFYRLAVALMQRHGESGQSVSNAFQTNGLLVDGEWSRFFAQYRFLVGLSLDGPAELHNAHRGSSSGEGSYSEVIRAMRLLREAGVAHNVLAVVTRGSAGHAGGIYRHFRERGFSHMQFIPCLEVAGNSRTPAPFSVSPEAYADFLCELFDLWLPEALDGVSVRLFDGLLQRELTGRSGMCDLDGDCAGYLVIEQNGDAFPCDFFVREEMRLGNIGRSAPEKLMDRAPARQLRSARRSLPEACGECPWRELCRGGCLKDRERAAGRLEAPTPFCATWRRFFPHAAEPVRKLALAMRKRNPSPPEPSGPVGRR